MTKSQAALATHAFRTIGMPSIMKKHNPFPVTVAHNDGLGDEGKTRDPLQDVNMRLCKAIRAKLDWHYPGHPWGVAVNHRIGMAQILMPSFTDWSFCIRLSDLAGDPGMKVVVRGAGELLERYRIPRCSYSSAHYLEALKKYKPWLTRGLRPPE